MNFIKKVIEFIDPVCTQNLNQDDLFEFPPKSEEWKYTKLSGLKNFDPAPISKTSVKSRSDNQIIFENSKLISNNTNHNLTQINGETDFKDTSYKNDEVLDKLNQIISKYSYQLNISKSSEDSIKIHSTGDAISGARIYLKLSKNVEASVYFNPDTNGVICNFVAVALDEGAKLNFYNFENVNATYLNQYVFNLSKDSYLNFINTSSGSGTSRLNGIFNLNSNDATLNLGSICCANKEAHIDNHFYVNHNAPNTNSTIDVKSILSDISKYIFNGSVFVGKKCDGSNSDQMNKNILLSNHSTVNAKPELKIFSNDVKAKHGSTTGRITDEELFYMCSRGLDENTANYLMLSGCITGITKNINQDCRSAIEEQLLDVLDKAISKNV